jgi:hypothetical protein
MFGRSKSTINKVLLFNRTGRKFVGTGNGRADGPVSTAVRRRLDLLDTVADLREQLMARDRTIRDLTGRCESYFAAAASVAISKAPNTSVEFLLTTPLERKKLIQAISDPTATEIYVVVYALTLRGVAEAIKKQHLAGKSIVLVHDRVWTLSCRAAVNILLDLLAFGVTVLHRTCSMHYKMVLVIYDDGRVYCSSGSANLTKAAFEKNDEHLVIVRGDAGKLTIVSCIYEPS